MSKMATNKHKSGNSEMGFSVFKKITKWLVGLLAGSALGLLIITGGIWLVGVDTDNWFEIKKVEVNGHNYTQGAEIYKALKKVTDKGFFTMEMQRVEDEVMALAWVKSVQLRKIWPEIIQIDIEEHEPLAYWGEKGVVTTTGKVIYPEQLPKEQWVSLNGPDNLAKELTVILQGYQQQLQQKKMVIENIKLSERGAISLQLSNGLKIELGKTHIEKRLERLIEHIDLLQGHKKEPLAYLDLRYENGLAARWQENENAK